MKLAVLDVETTRMTDRERPRTLFWGLAVDGEEYRRFETTAQLWNFLRRYPEQLLLYHHHDYDVIQALMDGAPLRIGDVRNGRVLRSRGPGNHEWRNSYALFPSGLAEILKACGYEKKELHALEARNYGDTVEALEAFKKVAGGFETAFNVNPLGGKYLTAASVAFAAAQLHSGPLPRYLENRDAYRGGRVEAFTVCPCMLPEETDYDGRWPVSEARTKKAREKIVAREIQKRCRCPRATAYDIGSSYPYAFLDLPSHDTLFYLDVEVSRKLTGPCPFFAMGWEKLMFYNGRFMTATWKSSYDRYVATHPGILRAKPHQKIACDLSWLKTTGELVRQAYGLRSRVKASNPPLAYAIKIGLNSIYGRLGMDAERQIAITGDTVAAGNDVPYRKLSLPGGTQFLSFVDVRTRPNANYLFASAITDNARARLYDALRKNPSVLYCDTDSIYVPEGTAFVGTQGKELGEWKREGTEQLTVRGLKDYIFGGEFKRKGGASHYEWSIRRALGRGEVREVLKHRASVYDKREILAGGKTRALTVSEW